MKASKGLVIGIVLALVVVGGAGAYAWKAAHTQKGPQYLTAVAKVGDVEDAVLATGALQPADIVNVGSQTSGQIVSMKVRLGDYIKKDTLIATIDPTNLQNQVRQAETQVNQARANLASVNANLVLQQTTLARAQELLTKGAGTQVNVDQAVASLASAAAGVNQTQNNVRNQELNLEAMQNNLDKANIRAPMDGVVAEMVAHEGQTINTNQTVPVIVKLAKMDVMTVRAQVSEADIVKVHPGQKVYFTILGEPGKRYYATLRARELTPAGGVLDPSGGGLQKGAIYYNVLFEVPNTDSVLFPAMTAEVHVVLGEAKAVLTVPSVALSGKDANGNQTVRVVGSDGQAADRKVVVGLNNNFTAEIKSGLKAGDKVVIGEATAPAAAGAPSQPLFGSSPVPQS